MRRPDAAPARLLGMRPGDDPAGMARLVRSSVNAPRDSVPALKGRIRSTLRRRSVWRRRYVRAGVVGVIIFLAGGVVGAMVQPIIRFHKQHRVESVENIYPSAARSRGPRVAVARPASSPIALDENLDLSAELPPMAAPPSEASPGPWATEQPPAPSVPPGPSSSAVSPRAAATAPTLAAPSASTSAKPSPPRSSIPAPEVSARPAASASRSPDSPSRSVRAPTPVPQGEATHQPSTAQALPAHRSADDLYPRLAMLEPPRQPEHQAAGPSPSLPQPAVTVPAAYAPPPPAQSAAPVAPAPPAPVASPAPWQIAPGTSEQVLLARALRSLRSQRRPDDALAILDAYAVRFPAGSLGPEAARLRTEALLALGQKPAALAELNRDLGSNTVGAEENRLVRGELHANAGRWKDALLDFDAVARARVAREPSASASASAKLRDHLERALWGRASARSHLGDHAGAAADLRDYLQRFPRGRFAAQAGHLLGELR